jgi:hypothetical protein
MSTIAGLKNAIPSTRLMNHKLKGFQDWKRVRVVSGNGGDGSISFEKSAKVAFG